MTEPTSRDVRVSWQGTELVPVQMANQFLAQVDTVGSRADLLILSVGQVAPPILLGTTEEREGQLASIDEVQVLPIARYGITIGRLQDLIGLLTRVSEAMLQNDPKLMQEDAEER